MTLGEDALENVFGFEYLGSEVQADGDCEHAVEVRMAQAGYRFGRLTEVWASDLPLAAKLNLYSAGVVSVLTHAHESWTLSVKLRSKLKGWNTRCLHKITGRSIPDESRSPTWDLVGKLRARRLKWAGEILRLHESRMHRQVLVAQFEAHGLQDGSLLMDAPHCESVQELLLLAASDDWAKAVAALAPKGKRAKDKLEALMAAARLTEFGTLSGWSWAPAGDTKHFSVDGTEWYSEAQLRAQKAN